MRLIPKQHQLKFLSATDQEYWRGYFEGYNAATIQTERKKRPMSLAEKFQAAKGMSKFEAQAFFEESRGRLVYE